jgi:hypothetical protein
MGADRIRLPLRKHSARDGCDGQDEIDEALEAGLKKAHTLKQNGLICACVLSCQGWFVSTETTRIQRMF